MYVHRHDSQEAVAVWSFNRTTPEEWDEHFGHLREVATWSRATAKRAACLLIGGKDFDRPDAKRRQELAQLTEAPGYDPYVAFVTPNTALRAVLTVFKWVQKAPKYEMDFFGSSSEGVHWLARQRGGRIIVLERMLRDVEREIQDRDRIRAHG
jgi:hypothetical protein